MGSFHLLLFFSFLPKFFIHFLFTPFSKNIFDRKGWHVRPMAARSSGAPGKSQGYESLVGSQVFRKLDPTKALPTDQNVTLVNMHM